MTLRESYLESISVDLKYNCIFAIFDKSIDGRYVASFRLSEDCDKDGMELYFGDWGFLYDKQIESFIKHKNCPPMEIPVIVEMFDDAIIVTTDNFFEFAKLMFKR